MDAMTRVREHYEIAKTVVPEELIIGCFLYGSQNYNMADEKSDIDTKVLVVPSLADVVCARRPVAFEHHCDNGEHLCFTDIREFVYQIRKQNPNSMESLFTKYYVLNPVFKGVWYDLWGGGGKERILLILILVKQWTQCDIWQIKNIIR